ncbi:MAG: TIR domain-containing protein, partial [Bacteroidota bacterium]
KHIAQTLSNWLEQVLQAVEPWVSSDIEKGKRWDGEISKRLEESKVGIICLTSDNLESTWIHFEAGAISKTTDAYVCTFLFDITPANVKEPLSLFQATKYNKEDVLKLLKTINSLLNEVGSKSLKESNLESVFNTFWPQLEEKLNQTPKSKPNQEIIRTDREIMEESLQILRTLKENLPVKANVVTTLPINQSAMYEMVKPVWDKFSEEKKINITEMAQMQKVQEFRRYMMQNGNIIYSPPSLRNFFMQLLREVNL